MKNSLKRGFTLIELLVVIAIIGILSSVVLASLNTARSKGADAAIKSNLNNLRAQAELVYDTTNSYATVCADPNVDRAVRAAAAAQGGTASLTGTAASSATVTSCQNDATRWAVTAPLKSATTLNFCVDSTGKATTTLTVLAASTFACP
jgi:prepilin-type N-terminal cleavage/methylation domain-containing protein